MAPIPGCALRGIYGPDGRLGEVEDEKAGKDLLEDEVQFLRMKMGEMGMFSGLAYCADCGARLYHCRRTLDA